MVDFFNRLDVPSLDPLGDTAYPLRPAGAYQTAGLSKPSIPVVFNGDGTDTQDAIRRAAEAAMRATPLGGIPLGAIGAGVTTGVEKLDSLVNHTLVGVLGICTLILGAYMLLRD